MKTPKHLATVMAITMVAGSVAPVMAATTSSETIIGNDRHETAVKISKEGWKSAETVILVNSSAIPDALTATPLAHAKNAPILLTGKDGLNKATANEIKRLGAKDVIMIGGDAVLSAKVEKDLKALNVKVDRIKGETREETALAIAKRLDGIKDVSEIAVVNGTTGLADAVSVAAAAAEKGMPILLANPKKGLSVAEKFIKDEAIKASFVIGGKTVLPEKLVSSLPGKQRIEGLDRKDTNAKVIEKFYTGKELNNVYLAKDGMGDSGQLIDALAVGALAAKNGAPVLIASKKLSEKQIDVINTKKIDTITQVGGKGNEGAFNQLKDIEETDVYEVGTVEELKEALEKANANDKIVLKPNATITEDIIINTDKNVDIKVEGTVTGKVEITAPNGNVTDNSTSKPSGGGSTGGPVTPSVSVSSVKATVSGNDIDVEATVSNAGNNNAKIEIIKDGKVVKEKSDVAIVNGRVNYKFRTIAEGDYTVKVTVGSSSKTSTFKIESKLIKVEGNELQKAIDTAGNGGTVYLVGDCTISSIIDFTQTSKITIDLNNYKLISNSKSTISVGKDKELNIKNGKINLETSYVTQSSLFAENGGVINLDKVEYTTNGSGIYLKGASKSTVKDTIINASAYCVSTNATNSTYHGVEFNLIDSTFNVKSGIGGTPVFINVPGKLNMTRCHANGDYQGMVVRGGTVNIVDSFITNNVPDTWSNKQEEYKDKDWGTGNELPLAAITIGNKYTKEGSESPYNYASNVNIVNTEIKDLNTNNKYPAIYMCGNKTEGNGAFLKIDDLTKSKISGLIVLENETCSINDKKGPFTE